MGAAIGCCSLQDQSERDSARRSEENSSARCRQIENAAEREELHKLQLERFVNWLQQNGAQFPNLELRRYAHNYRGVHIKSGNDLTRGHVLLRVPHKLLITTELAKSTVTGSIISAYSGVGPQTLIAVYLLEERAKGESSRWKPWLDMLPDSFDTLPMFFPPDLMNELKGCTDLLLKLENQRAVMLDGYSELCDIKNSHKIPLNFTYEEFEWAHLAVGTRVFSLTIKGQKTSVLAPLADMMNHKDPAGTVWAYDVNTDCFTLTANSTLHDGQPVFENYGVKDNKRFFASYGFVIDDNPANEVFLSLKGPSEDNLPRKFPVRAYYDAYYQRLLSYLRGVRLQSSDKGSSQFIEALSVDIEITVLKNVRQACIERLKRFATTSEDDRKLLESEKLQGFSNLRNCISFRYQEKVLYELHEQVATEIIGILSQPRQVALPKVQDLVYAKGGTCKMNMLVMYATEVLVPLFFDPSPKTTPRVIDRPHTSPAFLGATILEEGASRTSVESRDDDASDCERHSSGDTCSGWTLQEAT